MSTAEKALNTPRADLLLPKMAYAATQTCQAARPQITALFSESHL